MLWVDGEDDERKRERIGEDTFESVTEEIIRWDNSPDEIINNIKISLNLMTYGNLTYML